MDAQVYYSWAAKEKTAWCVERVGKDRQCVTYEIKGTECHNVYVGETSRSAFTRGREHEKSLSNKEERNIIRRNITRKCRDFK